MPGYRGHRARHQCFAVCAPGIEAILQRELAGIGVSHLDAVPGGVAFTASTRQLYAANVWLRTATRVLLRVHEFRATDFSRLEREVSSIPWDRWVPAGASVHVRVTARKSRLHHTSAIEERVHRGIGVHSHGHPAGEHDQLVVVRADHDRFTVSVDTSGVPLYKRGWRVRATRSPLRETLAAAMLLAVGWQPSQPLIDPFCGSGTIPIEAALLALGRAPGAGRDFAFHRWPSFEPGTWASVRAEAQRSASVPTVPMMIRGTDRDAGAVATAEDNARRAGVSAHLTFERAAISELAPPEGTSGPGWIVSNPPYGRRLASTGDLRDLFARFGQVVRAQLPGWSIALLVQDRRAADHAALGWTERFRTTNGGIPVRCVTALAPVAS